MDETIAKLAAIRRRQHAAAQNLLSNNPDNADAQTVARLDAELCAALTEAVRTHGVAAGVSSPVALAATAPKD